MATPKLLGSPKELEVIIQPMDDGDTIEKKHAAPERAVGPASKTAEVSTDFGSEEVISDESPLFFNVEAGGAGAFGHAVESHTPMF